MRHYLLTLCSLVLLSTTAQALDRDISGIQLFRSSMEKSKAEVQPVIGQIFFDEKEAFRLSNAALGRQVGDYNFTDRSGRKVRISDFHGKPLVVSLIYTHCPFICATTTRSLSTLKASQEALGEDSFNVLTVGFDTEHDTPAAMDDFAKRMGVNLPRWNFVSTDAETIKKFSSDLGFVYVPVEEGGFNHTTQTTFIDGQGKVYRQIYGDEFDNQTLLDPLKEMIYNVKTKQPGLDGLSSKVRLFCTIYDSKAGKYVVRYDYFYGVGLGVLVTLLISLWIWYEYRRSPKRHYEQ